MTPIDQHVGRIIRNERHKAKVGFREIASRLAVSRQLVSSLERGVIQWRVGQLVDFARVCNVSPANVLRKAIQEQANATSKRKAGRTAK